MGDPVPESAPSLLSLEDTELARMVRELPWEPQGQLATAELWARYGGRIERHMRWLSFRHCPWWVERRGFCEDLSGKVKDKLLSAGETGVRRIGLYDGRGSFEGFVRAISTRVALDLVDQCPPPMIDSTEVPEPAASEASDPGVAVAGREATRILKQLVESGTLAPTSAFAVVQHCWAGKTFRQIAEEYSAAFFDLDPDAVPTKTAAVQYWYKRGLIQLRAAMDTRQDGASDSGSMT